MTDVPFDLIAMVTSAGGLEALTKVLKDLPPDLPAGVLVVQHLGGQGSTLAEILDRRVPLPVKWVTDGARIQPGQVLVCPPRKRLEVLPDGTCALSPAERGALDNPLNFFLESMADSYGARALAVVLTGMGKDGAAGARALRQAGGAVLVQSEDTAEQPSMPRATMDAGAASLVLPLPEIGPVIREVISGGNLPRPDTEIQAAERLFAGPGETARLLREIDWTRTPLGPVQGWPVSLRTALRLVLESPMPMIVLWGPDYVQLYNDHYRLLMGEKHPAGLGQPSRECWPEVWHLNEPIFTRVFKGEPVALEDALYPITRHGSLENAWFNLYYTPVRDEKGAVAGVLATTFETTSRVLATRRLHTLNSLAAATAGAMTLTAAFEGALTALAQNAEDVPFALGYLLESHPAKPAASLAANLAAAVGLEPGTPAAPRTINLRQGHPVWPLARVASGGEPVLLDDLAARFQGFHSGPWPETPGSAFLVPLRLAREDPPVGVLVAGIGPRLPFDAVYRGFLELVAVQIAAGLAEAQSRQKERERMERLAELDRAKNEFFSNISHEFRTPLTLLLAPLDDLLHHRTELPGPLLAEIEVAARNARRLLALVNSLLDFSQLGAGRLRAYYQPTDLAALTADIASLFRSAAERAGLRLRVDCPPLPEPVWVDREMWEKIVSNLLSNALKFTFAGEIVVELRARPQHAEFVVSDTGVGIPEKEIPHIFKRFHRVRDSQARTYEGLGIGLALAHELVRRHHGRIRVRSQEGQGSSFTVWIPIGPRLGLAPPSEPEDGGREAARKPGMAGSEPRMAAILAEDAYHWSDREQGGEAPAARDPETGRDPFEGLPLEARQSGARLLVVDDNADMRGYFVRLLSPYWQVETAAEGEEALQSARRDPPDLILADVMMPKMDGFALLRQIRQEEALKELPVILVTARAGEEAALDGLLAGADDYLAKPFSVRELVARVSGQLERARAAAARRKSEEYFRAFVVASSDVVFRMSPDWKEMRFLLGKDFLADTEDPTSGWVNRYIPAEDRPSVLGVIEEAIRGKHIFELKHRVIRRDGSVGWTHSRAIPVMDEGGEIIEWFGTAREITERLPPE